MFGPRIPNVAKIKSEEPRIDVVRRTFDFVLPICLKAEQSVTFFSRLEIFLWRSSLERKRRKEGKKTELRRRGECDDEFNNDTHKYI
jgi:hypothetical protein